MTTEQMTLLKQFVSVDYDDDDALLTSLWEDAYEAVVTMTHRSESELKAEGGELPRPLLRAVCQLTALWYAQREAAASVSISSVPFGISYLVKPYVRLVNDCGKT